MLDNEQRATQAELIELRKEIDLLRHEQSQLNALALGDEGHRHAFIGAQMDFLRRVEDLLSRPRGLTWQRVIDCQLN